MTTIFRRLGRGLYGQAYLLLALTTLMWAGNSIAGKLAVGEISPMAMTCLRWVIVCAVLAVAAGGQIRAEWRALLPAWRSILLMGTFGFTGFNALFYAAAHYTTAINISIIQGAIPIVVLVGALIFFGTRILWLQMVGVVATLIGVAITATHGELAMLASLGLNAGDLSMLLASVFYAGYTLALRNRPKVSGLVFFAALAGVACLTSIPLLVAEIVTDRIAWPTGEGLAILAYVAFFPSLLSQLLYMRGVELIGPGRAGLFINLLPIFGALLAVLILGEPLRPYHAAGLALVLGGIWVAERAGKTGC
ncbi:DMT family transporter [Chelatococcus sp. SYSU_G07232]|uniref:DMT family transporter n=1 Tax=Chelatococcus albus TaxID=3047466 RepID=A0ABT7AGJ6_9HYPH|nr:DMT family transporter [Chelatococcus sp. SYSU_G07232]MDJ1158230.1 DMT family transporter [Chelatococcus sp. SYSU_G07232]